ncbi:hypothetical protein [Allomesorhizobium camelthorni]|uniref:Uncharacterized protein n=1 Tax=Allomesorhizobium camelthorni TaxID=475069 RepID=A0A6G4WIY5_9HYPH|nr:hypothetical protein [Mesorhizobium camelthorni]NGO54762.1 hypothetical protein [Mesorhizobium camelthorni]
MDQMLVWTFIHREVLRTRADRKPVDFIDIYEDNSSSLGLFRRVGGLLKWARSWRVSARPPTCDSGRQQIASESNCRLGAETVLFAHNVP